MFSGFFKDLYLSEELVILKGARILVAKIRWIPFVVALLIGISVMSSVESCAEGQRITSMKSQMMTIQKNQEEKVIVKDREVKQQVVAKTFKSVNPSLDDGAALKFAQYVMEAGDYFGVDPFLIASIIIKESHVKYKAKSKRAAYGLMQVNWKVHRNNISNTFSDIRTLSDLIQPKNNILVGTYIFSCYFKSSGGNVSKALSRYLGASGRKYIASVMKYHGEMKDLYSFHIEQTKQQIS